jgi:hypothetical protein
MRLKVFMVACCALGVAMPTLLKAQSMSKNPPSKAMAPMADSQPMMPSHDSSMKKPSKSMTSMGKAKSSSGMDKSKPADAMGKKKKSAMRDSGMAKPPMKADTASKMKKPTR